VSTPAPSPDPYDALRIPEVRAFAVGRVAAGMGTQFISVAVGWELYERTGDPWALGLVGLVQAAPVFFMMLPAGHAADRFARRDVAMVGYGLFALAALGLAAVSWSHGPVALVYGLLLLVGTARSLASPAVDSLLPQLVQPRQLANAQAWLATTGQVSQIGGPAVGGLLIALFGVAAWTYLVAAGLGVVFVALLTTIPAITPPPNLGKRSVADLFAGLHFIGRSQIFLAAMTLDLFGVLFGGAVALLPVYARDILEVGPSGLGVLRAAPPLGALAMALVMTRLRPWARPGRVLLLVVAGFGLATVDFGLSRSLPLSLACVVMVGAFDSVSGVIRGTLQQMVTPDRLRGRVAAVEKVFVGFSNELGAFESGAVAALFGPVVSVVSGGLVTLGVAAAVAWIWPALARVGPLHTLGPLNTEPQEDDRGRVAS
jgi:MFS family permease